MKFTLMLISLLVADVPMCAQAQAPQTTQEPQAPKPPQAPKAPKAKAAKSSKETTKETTKVAAAQKVVKTISADKAKTQTYCDIGKLGDQIQEADKKGDMKKIDEWTTAFSVVRRRRNFSLPIGRTAFAAVTRASTKWQVRHGIARIFDTELC